MTLESPLEDYYKEPTYSRFFINNQYPLYGKIYTGTEEQDDHLKERLINDFPNGILVKTHDGYKLITKEVLYSKEELIEIEKNQVKTWTPIGIFIVILVCLAAFAATLILGYFFFILVFYVAWKRRPEVRKPFLRSLIWPVGIFWNI